jgi:AraC-like DNA-binding protein
LFELEQVRHHLLGLEWTPHWHREWSIGAVVRGECRCSVGGRPMRAVAGDLIAIAPEVVHTGALATAAGRAPVLVIMFYVPLSWFTLAGLAPPAATGWCSAPALARSSERLRTADEVRAWLARAVPLFSARRVSVEVGESPSPAERRLLGQVQQALLDGCLAVSSLARQCGVSRERLHRVVRRWTGVGPAEYSRCMRVNRARELLLRGDTPSDAALACGFSDQAHFTRWFRRIFGYTPGDLQAASRRGRSPGGGECDPGALA